MHKISNVAVLSQTVVRCLMDTCITAYYFTLDRPGLLGGSPYFAIGTIQNVDQKM